MNYIQNVDQYGNTDTNEDGIIDIRDANYQTDTLFTPTGIGAGQVTGDFRGGFSGDQVRGACLDSDNEIIDPDIRSQQDCTDSDNRWDPNFLISSDTSTGGFSGDQVRGACLDSDNQIIDPDIRSQQDCTDSDNRWDPNFLISSDTSTGGCFDANNVLLSDITSANLCTGEGRTWDQDYMRETELLSGPNALNNFIESMNNGRVSDITMVENVHKITNDSTSTDYFTENSLQVASGLTRTFRPDNQVTAVKGLVEESALSNYFFSPENTKVIQDTLRFKIYQNTQYVIDYQSPEELYIVMRSILLQHANFKVSTNDIITEIQALNKIVIDYCVGEVTSNVLQYKGYLDDLERLPTPIDRPMYSERSNNNTYDISNFIGV